MSKINIQVSRDTHRKLEDEGRKGQTFNDIVEEAVTLLHNEKLYDYWYFDYRDENQMNLQYGMVKIPKISQGSKIKINREDVESAIYSICEKLNIEVEIK